MALLLLLKAYMQKSINFPSFSLVLSLHVCPHRELKPTQHWAPRKGSLTSHCIRYKNTCNSILHNPHKNQSKSDQYPGIGHSNRHSRMCKKLVSVKRGDNLPTEGSIFLSSSARCNLSSEAQTFCSIKKKGGTYQWPRSNPWVGITPFSSHHCNGVQLQENRISDRKLLLLMRGSGPLPRNSDICSVRSPRHVAQICSFSFPQWKLWE